MTVKNKAEEIEEKSSPMVMIKNNEIRIISSEGVDYLQKIHELKMKSKKIMSYSKMFFSFGLMTGGLALSKVFVNIFSEGEVVAFVVSTIFLGAMAKLCQEASAETNSEQEAYEQEQNLAQVALKDDILQVSKQLAEHQSYLNGISLTQSLDFKKVKVMEKQING